MEVDYIGSTLLTLKENKMTYSIQLKNGQILRGFIKSPGENAFANIIFVHGLGEHINRYTSWAESFNREGIGFTGVDLPGHGISDGKRGHIKNFGQTDEMIEILIKHTVSAFPGLPVFIYGHSLGGGIVLDYILRNYPEVNGAIVTSPWLKLVMQPGKTKLQVASFIKHIFPSMAQPSGVNPEHLSRNKDVVQKYINDDLVHDRISISLYFSAANAAEHSMAHSGDLKVPLLLMHGSDDMICSHESSREFASGSEKAEFRLWDGGFHELHNDLVKEEVFSYITAWIKKIAG